MKKTTPLIISALLVAMTSTGLHADAITDVQNHYLTLGAEPFSFDRGEWLWHNKSQSNRECADCHGADLTKPGRHERTKKIIEPMASSANALRYTDLNKVEKWFTRNCKWTWGRECTAQEKGDLLEYLRRL
jgi:hypothetical protein